MTDIKQVAEGLSPVQRHCIQRCSDAPDWGRSGFGMSRTWPDIVYGYHKAGYSTIRALVRRGIADLTNEGVRGGVRLTPLGLAVRQHLLDSGGCDG